MGALAGGADAHGLGIYGASWSADSKKVLTVSADKTAKIWDTDGNLVQYVYHSIGCRRELTESQRTFNFEGGIEQQQLGVLWQGEHLLTVNLNGDINYLNPADPNKPLKVLKSHNKLITCLAYDTSAARLYSGSYDGAILQWHACVFYKV